MPTISGARIIPVMPRPTAAKLPAEAKSTPGSPGRGFLVPYSSRPTTQCKGRSEPITENSSDAPPTDASARSRPTTAPAASPSCGRPSPVPPRVPGPVRRRGTGGAAVNSPTFRYPTPAADPRTGRGESAPQGTHTKTVPLRRPPPRHRRRPPPHPTDLRVLAALFYFARADASCWPGDEAIAARVHRHPGTVRRALRRLEDLGYIRREVQGEPHRPPDPSDL